MKKKSKIETTKECWSSAVVLFMHLLSCSQIINCCEMIYMCPVSLVWEFLWLRVGLSKSPAVDNYVFSS